MGDIVIAADHEAPAFVLHLDELGDEAVEEGFFDRLPRRPARSGGTVQRRDRQVVPEVHPHEPALDVVFLHAETPDDPVRRAPGKDRDAAVAFFLGVDEGGVELGDIERLGWELMFLRLCFLHGYDVGSLLVHPAEEALPGGSPDAVEIARDDAEHGVRHSR